jgi:IrrE N-terminal-like domain
MEQPGTSRGTEIEIRTTETDIATQAATLAHEISHSILHWDADGKKITKRDGKESGKSQRELEAEATAYVVCSYFGITSPSNFYLATYKVTAAMLLEAVGTIGKTANTIWPDVSSKRARSCVTATRVLCPVAFCFLGIL